MQRLRCGPQRCRGDPFDRELDQFRTSYCVSQLPSFVYEMCEPVTEHRLHEASNQSKDDSLNGLPISDSKSKPITV